MYQSYFGLHKPPFGFSHDIDFFVACKSYQEALNTLLVGIKNGEGIIKVTGEVGSGKTMLCQKLLSTLNGQYVFASISQSSSDAYDLFSALAEAFSIHIPAGVSQNQLLKLITQKFLDLAHDNKQVLICLDEAQSMSHSQLENLRVLTNLESENHKLLQVVLFGQPELDTCLAAKSMRQLRQRIKFQYHLSGLFENELECYLNHRLNIAGYQGDSIFCKDAIRLMYRVTDGNPRLINILTDKSLLLVYGEGVREVLPRHIRQAAIDTPEIRSNWFFDKICKCLVALENHNQRYLVNNVVNKTLIDLEQRGETPGNALHANHFLHTVYRPLSLPGKIKYVLTFLCLIAGSLIWMSIYSVPFKSNAALFNHETVHQMKILPGRSEIGSSDGVAATKTVTALETEILESTDNPTQDDYAYDADIDLDYFLAFPVETYVTPRPKPTLLAKITDEPVQVIGKNLDILPARKPEQIAAASNEQITGNNQNEFDPTINFEETESLENPILVASIANNLSGMFSAKPDHQEIAAETDSTGSMASGQIVKQINSRQQIEHEFQQAVLLTQQGRISEALEIYYNVLKLDASHESARLFVVGILLENRRFAEAEHILTEGINLNPEQIEFAKILARIQIEHGNIELALDTLQNALPYALNKPDYHAFLGALLQHVLQHKAAIEHYRTAVHLSPDSGTWLMGLGISLQEEGHFAEALEAYRRALSSHGLNENLQIFINQRIRQVKRKVY